MGISATLEGLDVVVSGLESFGPRVQEAAYVGVVQALKVAYEASKAMISADDHTQKELDAMGNPYGFTHPQVIHDPDEVVHRQSGDYVDALTATPPTGVFGSILEGRVDMSGDPEMQQLDRWIQEGTTLMRPRPWMEKIVELYGDDIANIVQQSIDDAVTEAGAA